MKLSAAPFLWGVMALLLLPACSKEENLPPPREKHKVVRPAGIPAGMPGGEPAGIPGGIPAGIPAPEKEKPAPVPEEKKEALQDQKEKVKEEAPEEKPPETKEEPKDKGELGGYVVRDGDNLATIAGRMEVYRDPLKWIILFRFNLEALGRLPETPDFAQRKLPPGTRLKVVMPRQAIASGTESDSLWVANVMSARSSEEIVPLAVRLARRGFPVYMTRTQVKGQEWMRLRVGFFKGKTAAQEVGRKIKEAVQVEDPWILKAGKEEYDEFVGFLERDSGS
jgi:hypothetical protein